MDLSALTALVSGGVAIMTQVGRQGDRKHIERLRALDWEHGRSGRRQEAYLAALEQGVLLLEANQDDVKQLSKATSQVELYGPSGQLNFGASSGREVNQDALKHKMRTTPSPRGHV